MEKDLSENTNGGTNDFESLMEQSLRAPRSGDVLIGTVLLITRDNVIIDINYKCEGQVPLAEFLDHDGNVAVKDFEHVVKLDCEYIDNWSLWLDFKILAKTAAKVLHGDGW